MTSTTSIITGASGGIGAGIALRLAAEKHQLVLAARRAGDLRAGAAMAEFGSFDAFERASDNPWTPATGTGR